MDVFFATTNDSKVLSAQRHAPPGLEIIQAKMEIPEPRTPDIEEIARVKARYAYERLQKPVLGLDAGFYIPAWGGFPRSYVNFALDTLKIEGILKLVEGMDRKCYFDECLVYKDAHREQSFFAKVWGKLAWEPRGERKQYHWSDLARIFIPEGYDITHGEMNEEEFYAWSRDLKKPSAGKEFAKWAREHLLS